MDTLYDLLGALPRDDAEGLRTAFRRAVKGTHPDLRPNDPDAAQKFRQIVRAQEILGDGEQRAAYDHLLELARVEVVEHARAGRLHRLASWVMALAGLSAISIGGLALASVLWTSTSPEPSAGIDPVTTATVPAKLATTPEPSAAPIAAAVVTLPPLAPPLDITPPAIDLATTGEPERTHGFDHAFADISHAKRPARPAHAASPAKKGMTETAAKPALPRRTAANDLSRQESFPFNPRP